MASRVCRRRGRTHDRILTCEVQGDTEGCAQLVIAGVALPYGGTRVVYTREHACLAEF